MKQNVDVNNSQYYKSVQYVNNIGGTKNMIKTKTFIRYGTLESIHEYQKFIKENQRIKIVSVNLLSHDHILLTYEE